MYTYLTTYNGLVTFDNNDKLIYAIYIEKEILDFIRELINKGIVKNIHYIDEHGLTNDNKNNYIIIRLEMKDFTLLQNTLEEFKELQGVYNKLYYSCDLGKNLINIHMSSDKKDGIISLLENTNNIHLLNEVVTVGDSVHDLSMVYEFNGWIIRDKEIYNKNIGNFKATNNIRSLIKTYR